MLVESTISDCAGITGGGLFATDQANVTVKGGSRVERCEALGPFGRGAGIQALNSDVALLEGSVITDCHAGFIGGGMHLRPGRTQSPTRICRTLCRGLRRPLRCHGRTQAPGPGRRMFAGQLPTNSDAHVWRCRPNSFSIC